MIDKELLDILACPVCKGSLEYEQKKKKLICRSCKLAFRIEDGIPVMLVDEAERLAD